MNKRTETIFFALLLLDKLVGYEAYGSCVEVEVQINSSTLVGCEHGDWRGGQFAAFRGIPYARAPTGNYRFKGPVPLESYPERIDARNNGPDCPSIMITNASEDCLFLNVYTKKMEEHQPVIVFIHPGGFYLGTGSSTFLGPEYILEKDIVLVTFNYRLASLGFLNLGTKDIPGNAGFKDQVEVLRWTKRNIQHFGGDPNNISLMGYSAGAMSVCLHLISPMSQGLFHKAIIMSGSIPPQTRIPLYHQIDLARKQARLMNCNGTLIEPTEIVECLNKWDGVTISKTLRKMFLFAKDNPVYLWLPIVERDFGQERFLTEDPYDSLKMGHFAKVPIVTGFTTGEFCTSAEEIITNSSYLSEFNDEIERVAPICFMYTGHKNEKAITAKIQSYYFQNVTVEANAFKVLCDAFSDSLIRFGATELANIASKYTKVFPYIFSYRGRHSNLFYPGFEDAEHMDDLMYLFKMPSKLIAPTDPEAPIVQNMQSFLLKRIPYNYEFNENKFVDINSRIKVKNEPFFKHYHFWKGLIEPSFNAS